MCRLLLTWAIKSVPWTSISPTTTFARTLIVSYGCDDDGHHRHSAGISRNSICNELLNRVRLQSIHTTNNCSSHVKERHGTYEECNGSDKNVHPIRIVLFFKSSLSLFDLSKERKINRSKPKRVPSPSRFMAGSWNISTEG